MTLILSALRARPPYSGGGDPEKMKAVDGCGPGDITVWSGDGEGICYFGELIALGMKTRGCAGAWSSAC